MTFRRRQRRLALFLVATTSTVAAAYAVRLAAAGRAAPVRAGLIVFHQSTNAGMGSDPFGAIWTIRPDGTKLRKVLDGDECVDCYWSPRLSPDATRIAYADYVSSGSNAVFVMNSDGTKTKAVCVGKCDYPIAWSPDGHRLAVGTGSGESSRVGIFDLRSRSLRVLWRVPSVDSFDWAPDGRRIAVATNRGTLWLIRPDGTHAVVIGHGLVDPRWSPNGKLLLVTRYDGKGTGTVPAGGGKFTPLPYLLGNTGFEAAWSPDGRQILYTGDGLHVRDRLSGRDRQLDPRTRSICNHPATGRYDKGRTYCTDLDWRN